MGSVPLGLPAVGREGMPVSDRLLSVGMPVGIALLLLGIVLLVWSARPGRRE